MLRHLTARRGVDLFPKTITTKKILVTGCNSPFAQALCATLVKKYRPNLILGADTAKAQCPSQPKQAYKSMFTSMSRLASRRSNPLKGVQTQLLSNFEEFFQLYWKRNIGAIINLSNFHLRQPEASDEVMFSHRKNFGILLDFARKFNCM
jgi:hypothetical protein